MIPAAVPRTAATTRSGIVAIDKPAGMTSFDAVRVVRRVFDERRVGHAGTLDPTATGLLPICIGQATRLVDYFHQQTKTYHCVVRFGERSETLDTEGEVVSGGDASPLTEADVRRVADGFVGDIEQVPPMHSAVRHEGRHLYELARSGQQVERKARPVRIESIEVTAFRPGPRAEAELVVVSGKGAYMRVLAAEIGESLGTGGLLAWLSRTAYGALRLEDAVTPDALAEYDDPATALLPPDRAVSFLPRVDLAPQQATMIGRGQSVWLPRVPELSAGNQCRVHSADGRLIAIGEIAGNLLRPTKVLNS
ncbi:MAG TPA: tRNA pseudouridine(55) synthase TruB [Candidatus Dormibacteraeota bacterium]|nr:tRNA pseudouridine(55) synthase TruB [Candidatus Dormibacteraeota bacterium]